MTPIHLRCRIDTLCALVAASAASVAVLGGAVLLFQGAGTTPVFEAGSRLAQSTSTCRHAATIELRHLCLRDVAALSPHETAVAASGVPAPALP